MRERSSTNSQINPFTSNLTVPRDEREPRKRISAEAGSIDSIGWLAKIRKLNQQVYEAWKHKIKWIIQSNPPKTAIRVTPLRPVCLLHPMYYQDEEKDYKAPEFPQVIKEFCADISVDLSTVSRYLLKYYILVISDRVEKLWNCWKTSQGVRWRKICEIHELTILQNSLAFFCAGW